MDEDNKPRPRCNCKTSQCIQRYCQCLGDQWFCSDACRCESCYNTEAREAFVEERAELIRKSKYKAFQPKHRTCSKSECKKNYCDCFKNRVACTERCQCTGCANTHGAKGAKPGAILLHNNGNSGGSGGAPNANGVGTPDGSNGTSNETAVIAYESPVSPPESRAPSKSELDAFFKYHSDQEVLSHIFRSVMRHSMVQAPWSPNTNSGSQDSPSGMPFLIKKKLIIMKETALKT